MCSDVYSMREETQNNPSLQERQNKQQHDDDMQAHFKSVQTESRDHTETHTDSQRQLEQNQAEQKSEEASEDKNSLMIICSSPEIQTIKTLLTSFFFYIKLEKQ